MTGQVESIIEKNFNQFLGVTSRQPHRWGSGLIITLMKFRKLTTIIIAAIMLLAINLSLSAQNRTIKITEFIAPVALIGLGAVAAFTPWGQSLNADVKGIFERDNFQQFKIDDLGQFLPLAVTYGLNLCGVRGRSNYRDLTMIVATSTLIMLGGVHVVKTLTGVLRPDGSGFNSFPSGHTAMAFLGAEILYQEYKHLSPWYGIGGYLAASAVGAMRIYNNRHWLSDVVAGAGVGIVSAKLAYLIYPSMREWLFSGKNKKLKKSNTPNVSTMVLPFYNGQQFGAGMTLRF